jgi:hypothetical protein
VIPGAFLERVLSWPWHKIEHIFWWLIESAKLTC